MAAAALGGTQCQAFASSTCSSPRRVAAASCEVTRQIRQVRPFRHAPCGLPWRHLHCNSSLHHSNQQLCTDRRGPSLVACASAAAAPGAGGSDAAAADASWFSRVVLPLALVLLVCNMDRICLSVAILPMAQQFGWPATVQGLIQSAFLWGYTATQLLGGHLADKFGGRAVIGFGVA
eukprot:GHRQ01009143.1.p1 GENE.GHRQ01009143.1~~GHRQ01009143.1.p1  ORF type:complete len:177 (+),score=52.47 GHRQ01009143.1:288-818(+)